MKKNIRETRKIDREFEMYSFEEILGNESKQFQERFYRELARIKLVHQIRELRRSKKLTQKGFAEKVGMPQSVIARLETGKHNISLSTLIEIASAFGKEVKLV